MPELPEVETMVCGIRGTVEGAKIVALLACPCRCRPLTIAPPAKEFAQRIRGLHIQTVSRRGKRIVIDLADSKHIVFEPRMTGLALIDAPPDTEHLRYQMILQRGKSQKPLFFWDRRGLGTLRLYTTQEIDLALGPRHLGPDALEITVDQLFSRLKTTKREIKVALLDQKLIAGIGNLYAAEILHAARIHPQAQSSKVSRKRVAQLHESIGSILRKAICYEGSTLNDGTYRNALNQAGSYQEHHLVYAKVGEGCPTCGNGQIQRIVQAQRSTFFCNSCQRY